MPIPAFCGCSSPLLAQSSLLRLQGGTRQGAACCRLPLVPHSPVSFLKHRRPKAPPSTTCSLLSYTTALSVSVGIGKPEIKRHLPHGRMSAPPRIYRILNPEARKCPKQRELAEIRVQTSLGYLNSTKIVHILLPERPKTSCIQTALNGKHSLSVERRLKHQSPITSWRPSICTSRSTKPESEHY